MPQITTPRTVTATSTPRQTLTTINCLSETQNKQKEISEKKDIETLEWLTLELSLFAKVWLSMMRGGRRQRRKVPTSSQPITCVGYLKRTRYDLQAQWLQSCEPWKQFTQLHHQWFDLIYNMRSIGMTSFIFWISFFLSLLTCNKCRLRHGRWHTPLERAWAEHRVRIIEESIVLSNKKY